MTKGRIAKYVANTALLAVLAAAGIGVYQLGTSGKDESVPEKVPSYYDETAYSIFLSAAVTLFAGSN